MKEILTKLFNQCIELGDNNYSKEQIESKWIGNLPSDLKTIENANKRLGIVLPQDYVEMLTIANGFSTYSNSVDPSFKKVEEIDFYKNTQGNVIKIWKELGGITDVVSDLERAIVIAGSEEEEEQFLLIPPENNQKKWKYWKFAMWIPGEHEYQNLKHYFNSVIEFLSTEIREK